MMKEDTFIFLHKYICCEPSSEPSRQDGPNEGLQHTFLLIDKKLPLNYPLISTYNYNS